MEVRDQALFEDVCKCTAVIARLARPISWSVHISLYMRNHKIPKLLLDVLCQFVQKFAPTKSSHYTVLH